MDLLVALILGLVQGLTEFLPVSSSGHLVIVDSLLGEESGGATLAVLLHVGTAVPVVWVLRRPLREVLRAAFAPRRWLAPGNEDPHAELLRFVVLGTAVTGLVAFPLKDVFERWFESPRAAGTALLGTTAILLLSRWLPDRGDSRVRWWQALGIGLAQALAVTPGISRSGSTIVAALALGVGRSRAGTASFLLSVPAILGGAVIEAKDAEQWTISPAVAVIGMATAALSGFLALRWTLRFLDSGRFWWFAGWTLPVALAVLLFAGE